MELLALGGMAEIYRAKKRGLDGFEKDVAIKVLLPHLAQDPEAAAMIIDEARIAAQLVHPNIVQVLDLIGKNGVYAIVLELVRGADLSTLAAKGVALSEGERCFVIDSVLRALAHAHRQGVVHRDIAPENVLVSLLGEVKLSDFGIAKAAARITQTRTGVIKGRLRYMAPEVARAEPVDARADVFSAAAFALELLTGKPLRAGGDDLALLEAARTVPSMDAHTSGLTPALREVFACALAGDPARRFVDADALLRAFTAATATIDRPSRQQLGERVTGVLAPREAGTVVVVAPRRRSRVALFVGIAALVGAAALALRWRSTPAPSPPASAPSVSARVPSPEPPAPPSEPAAAHGYLTLNAVPWAWIYLDGKKLARPTPIERLRVPVGVHEVRFVGPNAERRSVRIDVRADKVHTHFVRFDGD